MGQKEAAARGGWKEKRLSGQRGNRCCVGKCFVSRRADPITR